MTLREQELRENKATYLGLIRGARTILTLKGTTERGKAIRDWQKAVRDIDSQLDLIDVDRKMKGVK